MFYSKLNRYIWMGIFFVGVAIFTWLEVQGETASPVVLFLITGVWSAVCGIGFSVMNSFVRLKQATFAEDKTED